MHHPDLMGQQAGGQRAGRRGGPALQQEAPWELVEEGAGKVSAPGGQGLVRLVGRVGGLQVLCSFPNVGMA